jgi:hypothetical protein
MTENPSGDTSQFGKFGPFSQTFFLTHVANPDSRAYNIQAKGTLVILAILLLILNAMQKNVCDRSFILLQFRQVLPILRPATIVNK